MSRKRPSSTQPGELYNPNRKMYQPDFPGGAAGALPAQWRLGHPDLQGMNQLGNEYSTMCANWGNYPSLSNPTMVSNLFNLSPLTLILICSNTHTVLLKYINIKRLTWCT